MWVSCRCCKQKYELTKDNPPRKELHGYVVVYCSCGAEHYLSKLKPTRNEAAN